MKNRNDNTSETGTKARENEMTATQEPWEMTVDEYAMDAQHRYWAKMGRPIRASVMLDVGLAAARRHGNLVRKAADAGKLVPRAILAQATGE